MALDNLNRIEALNAVIAAWTDYESAPFVLRKEDIAPGDNFKFQVNPTWDGIFLGFGGTSNSIGCRMIHATAGTNTYKNISAFSEISVNRSGTTYTITNNSTADIDFIVLSLRGMCEEV